MSRKFPPLTLVLGIALMATCAVLLAVDVQRRGGAVAPPASAIPDPVGALGHVARWFAVNMTVLCWVGYLLSFDGLLAWTRGGSPIRRRPHRFIVAWLTSIPVWCFFDAVNFYLLDAWRYHGLPPVFWMRLLGYLLAFAAISPGMFLAAEAIQRLGMGRVRRLTGPWRVRLLWAAVAGVPLAIGVIVLLILPWTDGPMSDVRGGVATALLLLGPVTASLLRRRSALATATAAGFGMTAWALLVQQPIGTMTLWTGLIYLLDPLSAKLGGPSLLRDWEAGRWGRTAALFAGGLFCGFLWELWNYWAIAKWTYHLPFLGALEPVRYFEMPVVGLLGFLPFAAECWVALNVIIALLDRLRLRVAEPLPDRDAIM
jgi:hypothetical protein